MTDLKSLIAASDFSIKKSATLIDFDENEAKKQVKKRSRQLRDLQRDFYAHGKRSVLIVMQGMDAAGKDSLIRHVFGRTNPRGVEVHCFKVPTPVELGHDYLWRHQVALPIKGKMGIFNRSHYENLLVTRVHPEYLLNEQLPGIDSVSDVSDHFWHERMARINEWEKHLVQTGTTVLKFFLNISQKQQGYRLLSRLKVPEKNWKFSEGDIRERALWDQYMSCYEDAIAHTSTEHAPWYVIPADSKPVARMLVGDVTTKILSGMDLSPPTLAPDIYAKKDQYIAQLSQ